MSNTPWYLDALRQGVEAAENMSIHPDLKQAAVDQGIRPAGYDAPISEVDAAMLDTKHNGYGLGYQRGYADGLKFGKTIAYDAPIVTNQQMLSKVTPEEAFECMRWLFFDYAKEWSDSKAAIIEWLKAEKDVKRR